MRAYRFLIGISFIFAGLPGCVRYADLPPGTSRPIECALVSPVVEQQTVSVPPMETDISPPADYLVGAGDVLHVSVYGKPEMGTNPIAPNSKIQGSRVDGAGAIRIPLVGTVKVSGLTVEQIRIKLQDSYRTYMREPSVVVEVAEYKSQPLYLLGQYKLPGVYYLDRPMTLVQGVALGSGFDSAANLRGARLIRDGKTQPVDVHGLLVEGKIKQNIWLKSGDTIYIPDSRSQFVFVFGAVRKPGPVPIPPNGLNLAQAIASSELRDSGYDDRQVRIIRSRTATSGDLLVVDFAKIVRGEAYPLPMQEGDIVYIPKNGFGTWNDAINDILPSLQAIGAILQPFVAIKFLSQ